MISVALAYATCSPRVSVSRVLPGIQLEQTAAHGYVASCKLSSRVTDGRALENRPPSEGRTIAKIIYVALPVSRHRG